MKKLLAGIVLLAASAAHSQVVPDGFLLEHILTNPFSGSPVGFTWLPDGRVLVVEQNNSAAVRIKPVGSSTSTVIHTVPNVSTVGGERGLLGVAVDPAWPARPYIYFYYTHVDSVAYVTMYTASGDLVNPTSTSLSLASPFHLLTDIPDLQPNHNAGTLRFGPDCMLYVSLGDDAFSCSAQAPGTLAGKILRLDVSAMPGTGSGPPPKADITPSDNPFPGPDEDERLVWAFGLRNPFRFTVDSQNGDLVVGDVGANLYEEMDILPAADPGGNYGWPNREGFVDPMCCGSGTCGAAPFRDPIYAYPHVGVTPKSVIGGPRVRFVGGSALSMPASYDGSVFFHEFTDGWIRRLIETPTGWELAPAVPGQPSAENWVEGFHNLSDIQQGPDGALYLLKLFGTDRGLWRIAPDETLTGAENATPAASFALGPNPFRAGEIVMLRWSTRLPVPARLEIVDIAGRRVFSDTAPAGRTLARWDGRLPDGGLASPGVYLFRLETGATLRAGKLVVLR
ncbi:MAG: PQQ-dependent sugar dehydrogenase [Candidatus Eiseniibacteriota bacterium]